MSKTNTATTKSAKMIVAWQAGDDIATIAKSLKVRYNFVYNVVSRYCRKNSIEMTTNVEQSESKKSMIISLYFDEKLSMNKIAKKLNTNTSYVWSCVNDARLAQQ